MNTTSVRRKGRPGAEEAGSHPRQKGKASFLFNSILIISGYRIYSPSERSSSTVLQRPTVKPTTEIYWTTESTVLQRDLKSKAKSYLEAKNSAGTVPSSRSYQGEYASRLRVMIASRSDRPSACASARDSEGAPDWSRSPPRRKLTVGGTLVNSPPPLP